MDADTDRAFAYVILSIHFIEQFSCTCRGYYLTLRNFNRLRYNVNVEHCPTACPVNEVVDANKGYNKFTNSGRNFHSYQEAPKILTNLSILIYCTFKNNAIHVEMMAKRWTIHSMLANQVGGKKAINEMVIAVHCTT